MTKGLEALKRIGIIHISKGGNRMFDEYLFREYKEEYNIIEKELKALEIIKKKCDFMPLSKIKNLSYDLYVRWFDLNHYDVKLLLTREEFDLLKEVLKDEK